MLLGPTANTDTSPISTPTHLSSRPIKSILKPPLEPTESPETQSNKAVHFTEKVEFKQRTVTVEEVQAVEERSELPEVVRGRGSVCCELF